MWKGKHKKKAKQNSNLNSTQNINVVLSESISKEEMQHIISNAIIESENIREEKAKEQKEIELKEWHKTIGYKEQDNKFKKIINELKVFCKILFLKEKDIEGVTASTLLLKLSLSFFFRIISLGLFILFLISFILAFLPLHCFINQTSVVPGYLNVICFLLSILMFMLSRFIRIVSVEIEKSENFNYLFGWFASITSIVSIAIAVIAIVKGS